MIKTAIGRLRLIAMTEGVSFLVLLYFSIVEKRMNGNEDAIYIPGMVHGLLFCLFCWALLDVLLRKKISFKFSIVVFISSLVPFAPFVVDGMLRKKEADS